MIGICKACGEDKPFARYQKAGGGRFYFRKHCIQCWSEERRGYQTAYRSDNVIELKAYDKKRNAERTEYRSTATKRHYRKLQSIVFDHYGNKCACCGEAEKAFLTLDHKDNNGADHRRKIGVGHIFYRWIIDNGYPESIQILCHNCNSGKHRNGGICPHEAARLNSSKISGA